MPDTTHWRLADLSQTHPNPFSLIPEAPARADLAVEMDLLDLRKLRFEGQINAQGKRDWRLTGHLGATVVQPCVVTLDPVVTRIEAAVDVLYTDQYQEPGETEAEMPEDENREPLPDAIDLEAVMAEALALNLPAYPRKTEAELGEAVFTEPGQTPMRDEDARPFAGLAGLRDQLRKDE